MKQKEDLRCTSGGRACSAADAVATSMLVVDDNYMMRSMIGRMLTQLAPGATCNVSSCGEAGLETVRKDTHHLAFIDLAMPDMDGREVACRIREIERELGRPPMPLVAMSGDLCAIEWIECQRAGFGAFLQKPFCANALRSCLQVVLPEALG